MKRTAAVIVLVALTGPPAAHVVCELVFCAETHQSAAARQHDDCHGHRESTSGAAWSGPGQPCHDAADGIADAIVASASTDEIAPPLASPHLMPSSHRVLTWRGRSHSSSALSPPLRGSGQLRI